MYTSRSQTTVQASPCEVLALLTEPEATARWAPIPFEVLQLAGERLRAGSHARVAGRLAGASVEFDVDVLHASDQRLQLIADGSISLSVEYVMHQAPAGSEVQAAISVEGGGLLGRVLAKATDALLVAGGLRMSLERIARELQPALAAWAEPERNSSRADPSCGAARSRRFPETSFPQGRASRSPGRHSRNAWTAGRC